MGNVRSKKSFKKTAIKSTPDRLRLNVFRSNVHIFAQIIDDLKGQTIVSASSLKLGKINKTEAAKMVGAMIAKEAKTKNILNVVFDRGRYMYAGRLKVLADSARENGLSF